MMEERDDYQSRFAGIGRLYGVGPLERLRRAHACVVGLGGVGSWTAEALVRSGVGVLTLIDMDDICVNNTNRQLHTMDGTVGRTKVSVLAERFRLISPGCEVRAVEDFLLPSTVEELLSGDYDVVIDAIDDVPNKCLLLARCRERSISVVTVGGAGGRRDPTRLRVDDLSRSAGDGLLRQVRRTLRKEFAFDEMDGDWGIPCVFSTERPVYPSADGGVCATPEADSPVGLDCASGFGAATHVTGTFGFSAAAVALEILTA